MSGIINFLPTRLGPAAFLLLFTCAGHLALWAGTFSAQGHTQAILNVSGALVPWLGWLCWWKWRGQGTAFDRLWLDFRDRWGLMWSQRVREQFNHAAENAGWPVQLNWSGLVMRKDGAERGVADEGKYVETLRAVVQRFVAID